MNRSMVRASRFELETYGLEGRCSIQLSYTPRERSEHGSIVLVFCTLGMEWLMGLEATTTRVTALGYSH